jgi:NAD(P)-dependent dehydrogenase (short-subunit alcohol dehydrogenase family)
VSLPGRLHQHLGHFLLTGLLFDRLVRASAARVITVASIAHQGTGANGGWYLQRANYDRRIAYAKSKHANLMFAFELAERLRGTRVTSNAVDPGSVATNFGRNNGIIAWFRHLSGSALGRELVSARTGRGYADISVIFNGRGWITGKLFRHGLEVEPSAASRDRTEARRLWDLSVKLSGLEVVSRMGALVN